VLPQFRDDAAHVVEIMAIPDLLQRTVNMAARSKDTFPYSGE
jgi:hypothetical protein